VSEEDRLFRLEVLRLTLETGTAATVQNPLPAAEKNLQWCLQPLDKPLVQEAQSQSKKPRQA